jgi:hypothetical protein
MTVFAEPPPRLTPLAADAVKQTVFEGFFRGPLAVLVPDAGNTVPLTVSERHFFAEQTVSIPGFLNRGSHVMCIALRPLNVNFAPLNTNPGKKHSRSCPDFSDFFAFRHPETTDSRDEILKAKLPGGGGRVKVEAGAAGAHNLDATDAAIQSKGVSSRCPRTKLRSVVGERGKWSEGRREAPSESQPERNVPPPSRRRKPAAPAALRHASS